MMTPKFKIGDKVYTYNFIATPPLCPTCHQSDYDAKEELWEEEHMIKEHIIYGICVVEGGEFGDGVTYECSGEYHRKYSENEFVASYQEAEEAIQKKKDMKFGR